MTWAVVAGATTRDPGSALGRRRWKPAQYRGDESTAETLEPDQYLFRQDLIAAEVVRAVCFFSVLAGSGRTAT